MMAVFELDKLKKFAHESNGIETIDSDNADVDHVKALIIFLAFDELHINCLDEFNQFGNLRELPGMDFNVGPYYPPEGGPRVKSWLCEIIDGVNNQEHPYAIHQEFERLHPYTDGNGRTGRAIWLWQMVNQHGYDMSLGFLHKYYYQSLEYGD